MNRKRNDEMKPKNYAGFMIVIAIFIVVLYFITSPVSISSIAALQILSSMSEVSITLFVIFTAFVFVVLQVRLPRERVIDREETWKRFKRFTFDLFVSISFISLAFYCWLIMTLINPDYSFNLFPISCAFFWMAFNLLLMILIIHVTYTLLYPSEKTQQEG